VADEQRTWGEGWEIMWEIAAENKKLEEETRTPHPAVQARQHRGPAIVKQCRPALEQEAGGNEGRPVPAWLQ